MTTDDIFAEFAALAAKRSMPTAAHSRRAYSKRVQWTLAAVVFAALCAVGVLTVDHSPKNIWGDKAQPCDLMADGSHFQPC